MTDQPPNYDPAFGQLLKKTREEAGVSQAGLARELKLHRSYVFDVEKGDRPPMNLSRTIFVSRHLGADPIPLMMLAVKTRGIDADVTNKLPEADLRRILEAAL